jgi:predicted dehydrogenase
MAQQQMIRAGLVGCGEISSLHLKSMKQAGLEIVALCDIDKARAERRRDEFATPDTPVYTAFADMLRHQRMDVVGIATPPDRHKEQVLAALEAKSYVYCEKPVADTLFGIEQILRTEKATGAKAFYTTARFRGWDGLMVKQYIDDGDVGDIYRVDVQHFRTRGRPGVDTNLQSRWFADARQAIAGITGDMGLYFVDKALYLTGWPKVTGVSAMSFRQFPYEMPAGLTYDVEEHVVMLARTEGKLTFTFEFANISHHPFSTSMMVLGDKGGIHVTDRDKLKYMTEKGGAWKNVTHSAEWQDNEGPDVRAYRALAGCARGDGREVIAATSTPQVYLLHEVAQMAFLSAKERREVRPADLDKTHHIFFNRKA